MSVTLLADKPYVLEPENDVQKVTLDIVMRSMITRYLTPKPTNPSTSNTNPLSLQTH